MLEQSKIRQNLVSLTPKISACIEYEFVNRQTIPIAIVFFNAKTFKSLCMIKDLPKYADIFIN